MSFLLPLRPDLLTTGETLKSKFVYTVVLIVLGVLLTSCMVQPRIQTPEGATQAAVMQDAQGVAPARFRVLATHPWEGGVIVIYTLAHIGDLADLEPEDMHLSFVEQEQGT